MVLLQKYVAISSMCLSCVQINIMETTKPGVPRRRIWDRRVAAEAERLVEHLYSTLTWRHPQGVHSAKAEELQFQLSDNSITVAVTVMMAMRRKILSENNPLSSSSASATAKSQRRRGQDRRRIDVNGKTNRTH